MLKADYFHSDNLLKTMKKYSIKEALRCLEALNYWKLVCFAPLRFYTTKVSQIYSAKLPHFYTTKVSYYGMAEVSYFCSAPTVLFTQQKERDLVGDIYNNL
jgi:hypothetical protein